MSKEIFKSIDGNIETPVETINSLIRHLELMKVDLEELERVDITDVEIKTNLASIEMRNNGRKVLDKLLNDYLKQVDIR